MTSPVDPFPERGSASLVVVKVGGALLGDATDLDRVARALVARRRQGERLLVVVSALGGVTDALERAAFDSLDPRSGDEMVRDVVDQLWRRHRAVLADEPAAEAMALGVRRVLDGVERLLVGVRLTGELTDRTHDLLLAHGERLSAPLLAHALCSRGADARAVSADEAGLVATGPFGAAGCDTEASREGLAGLTHELHDRILVMTGFYGVGRDGHVRLFGRGGTDYSAGVVAAGLDAEALEFWKDVPGFLTTDPRAVPEARLVPELSFAEARELGSFGARILHPRCLDPLRGLPVRVEVRSVHDPDRCGTRIVEHRKRRGGVAALAHRGGMAWLRVRGAGPGPRTSLAATLLARLGEERVEVPVVSSSLSALAFVVDQDDLPRAQRALRLVEGIDRESLDVSKERSLIGVVGDGVAGDPRVAARLLDVLPGDVELLSHGPGEVGLSCVVPTSSEARTLSALHAEFFGSGERETARRTR